MPPAPRARSARPPLALVICCGCALVLLVSLLGLAVGDAPLTPAEVIAALSPGDTSANGIVMQTIRLPRVLLGIVTGAALAVAGALTQALTRNPIADPGMLGVTAGAGFSVVLAGLLLGSTAPVHTIWFALAGALGATVAVYAIASSGAAADPSRLLLAGVAMSALFGGVMTTLMQLDPNVFAQMSSWGAGSLSRRGWDALAAGVPAAAAGLLLAAAVAPMLNQLGLGDGLSAATGAPVARTRALTVLAIALLAGSATAMAGPIAFVGLMVPHVARRFAGPDQVRTVVYAAILGPSLLVTADVIGRVALPAGELPVGIVTGVVGAPVLVLILRRMRVPKS